MTTHPWGVSLAELSRWALPVAMHAQKRVLGEGGGTDLPVGGIESQLSDEAIQLSDLPGNAILTATGKKMIWRPHEIVGGGEEESFKKKSGGQR